MILLTESEEAIRSLPDHHALSDRIMGENNEKPQWKWHMKGVWATNFICHLIFGGHLLNIPKPEIRLISGFWLLNQDLNLGPSD